MILEVDFDGCEAACPPARVTGSCSNGSAIAQIAGSGAVSCQPSGAGTITGVGAGTGLSGGGSAGNVSLSLTPGYQLPQVCSANELVKWTGSAWTCAAQGPASGPAGGALSGTYPNPSLNVSGGDNGASGCQGGEAVTGISSLAALTCAGVSPSGAAGGDLTGSFPSPSIAAGAVTTSKFATTAEAPNAAKLGGISPSGFIQGTGSVIDGHQVVPQNTTGITVLNPPTGFLVVDCNAGGSYDVFYVTNPSNPNQETWYSHSGGTVAYTLGGIAVFDSSATSDDLITVHTTDGTHPITMVIGAHRGTGAGPCLFSGQAIVQ